MDFLGAEPPPPLQIPRPPSSSQCDVAKMEMLAACSQVPTVVGSSPLSAEGPWKVRGREGPLPKTKEECSAIKGLHAAQSQEELKKTKKNNSKRGRVGWEMLSLEEALSSLDAGMLPQPSVEDFACILRKCRKERNSARLLRLHAHIRRIGLEAHPSLGNHLVSMLVEVGSMRDAQQVFDRLVYRNQSSWSSLITGYVKCGEPQHALTLYQKIQQDDSLHPSGHTFVALLKACTKLKDLDRGYQIHAHIDRKGLLERDRFVGSSLVDMYAKCGLLAKAQEVFDKLPVRDVVLWNALIAGYAKHGCGTEALNCFEQMQLEGFSPTAITFVCSLKACGSIGATDKGREIHAEVARKGLERDLLVGSALVDMHAKCGSLDKAEEVFRKLPVRNVVSWTALIKGYAEHGRGEEALNCFEQMQREGIFPDIVTLVCSLKACGSIGAAEKGQEIHAEISRKGLERDLLVGCTLVDMYAKCGLLVKAQDVFDKLPVQDVVLWNTLMAGYVEHERGEEALKCFEQMQCEGISPNAVTFVCSLKACGSVVDIHKGLEIHAEISRKGLDKDLLVGSTLVSMYAKWGLLAKAQEVFDSLSAQDVVSWTALIAGYAEHGRGEEALNCFEQMQCEGFSPNAITFVCSLKACASVGATDKGQEIHAEISRKGLLEKDLVVGNALVDMYAKCGLPARAQEVFDKLPVRDVVSWNAVIAGYAQLGESESVFCILDKIVREGKKPTLVTFVSVLNACSHAGLVDLGQLYFEVMSKDYNIIPTLEHYTCMVDLLGRAGQLEKAVQMINKMQLDPDLVVWHTLLGACQNWGNVELGRQAFEQAVRLDEMDAAAYVSLSNIYTDHDDVEKDVNKGEAMTEKTSNHGGKDIHGEPLLWNREVELKSVRHF